MPHWRSLLFVAADAHSRFEKIAERGADAVILDLEDAVPADRKDQARDDLPSVIDLLAGKGCAVVVRINAGWRDVFRDLLAAARPGVAAIMVPKVENAARLRVIAEMVAEYAVEARLPSAPGLIALIESPAALPNLHQIAAVDGVIGLALGSEDFSLALGVSPSPQALDLPCRMVALAAAGRGLMALGQPCSIATIEDVEVWSVAIGRARAFGMTGALCVHPKQIAVVNSGFGHGEDEIAAARRLISAWENTQHPGVMQFEGRMVDRPVVLAARRIVERTETQGTHRGS